MLRHCIAAISVVRLPGSFFYPKFFFSQRLKFFLESTPQDASIARAVKLGNLFLIFGPMWLKNPGQLTSSRHKIKLQIWARAHQRYLVGPGSLTTHKPGHMVKVDTLAGRGARCQQVLRQQGDRVETETPNKEPKYERIHAVNTKS